MRRRQRKKLHLAEFIALGFYVTGTLRSGAYSDQLLDDWIDFVESRGLRCGGSFALAGHRHALLRRARPSDVYR